MPCDNPEETAAGCRDFAAHARVDVTVDGQGVATGMTDEMGALPTGGIQFRIPAQPASATPISVRVIDSRSQYPVLLHYLITG